MKIGAHYLGDGVCEFTVWAPNLNTVAVEIVSPDQRLLPMEQLGSYWQVIARDIEPGTLYLYQLNNSESRPDPASNFQPHGVHSPSQVIDHNFAWSDSNWSGVSLETMIMYELHVGTFTPEGTFEAIIPRLPDLRELGVNAIELMPVAQFPGHRNWGYDGVYPFAVQNSYGTPHQLKQLVDGCHQQGIAVILDVVYNHFGPEGNYTSRFGPYFTETYRTPWGTAINFDDAHSYEVRQFFIHNALYWLGEFHIDALRLDAIHAIYDLGAKHFLAELAENVAVFSQHQGRKFYLIAESDLNDPKIIRPHQSGGYGIDAQWSDDFHHSLYTLLTGDRIGYYQDFGKCEHLAKAYKDSFVYDWKYSNYRQRFHGNYPGDRPSYQFIVSIQNHDQIGNRILGERLSQIVNFEQLKLAAGVLLLSPYIPLLFMGEEYGEESPFMYFVSHSDPDLIKAVREGRKQEFFAFHSQGEPPDPESADIFNTCKLNWQKRKSGKHQVLFSFYQKLIQIRSQNRALLPRERHNLKINFQEEKQLISWFKFSGKNQIFCAMNFNNSDVTLSQEFTGGNWVKILDSAQKKWLGGGSNLPQKPKLCQQLTLTKQSFAVYEKY
ncbi:malto-oligosyltrehalose trehalohydrolase [Umezakia ovalisporum]|uniref:Malto-oligosyltrehalose trehalohydrolase n=1 Tax=Umezakia ovalisporum FSS-43 TaxID=2740520 RepID=A0ABT6K5B7_9CYAN|nr:malto-oligosyltrehalose trehalohydrolase [Umezakia ovalisporum]MBI1240809.1 malto-oligosyltrehalose trehalohydrolase [Nostoc sp. RI_552]MDH6057569.1 malto-oligosyltrehalose trehalohydrolase [Umezakia ovalisporum FSS-43]MDH6072377.1 malto-oligosyltrehalose trehalohydrolase [Umezakia ovalisporum CobakiLakeA]MDH6075841.1 malto-oligosyltrehalose trehalohydrolase [Umezakia ovalisporum CS-1034]MDH6082170.1 malto-oligosyltrehalose trehalohydrolase [Umezakia ovalisporum FSS-44]